MRNIVLSIVFISSLVACKARNPFYQPYSGYDTLSIHFSEDKGEYTFYHATRGRDTLVFVAKSKLNKCLGNKVIKVLPEGAESIGKLEIDGKPLYYLYYAWDANHQFRVAVVSGILGSNDGYYQTYSADPYYLTSAKKLICEDSVQ